MNLLEPHQMPIVAYRLKESLLRDLPDFEALSSEFDHTLVKELDRLAQVLLPQRRQAAPIEIPRVALLVQELAPQLLLLENRTRLSITTKLMRYIAEEDEKAIIKALKKLLLLFELHQEKLSEDAPETASLAGLQELVEVSHDASAQESPDLSLSDARDTLWQLMKKICIAGQRLYRSDDPGRAKEYSFKYLRERWCPKDGTKAA